MSRSGYRGPYRCQPDNYRQLPSVVQMRKQKTYNNNIIIILYYIINDVDRPMEAIRVTATANGRNKILYMRVALLFFRRCTSHHTIEMCVLLSNYQVKPVKNNT